MNGYSSGHNTIICNVTIRRRELWCIYIHPLARTHKHTHSSRIIIFRFHIVTRSLGGKGVITRAGAGEGNLMNKEGERMERSGGETNTVFVFCHE